MKLPATFPHRIFLFWLLYLVIVLYGFGILLVFNIPQIALHYDRSYLTYVLLGLYLLAEALSARQVWILSSENKIADSVVQWLSKNKLTGTSCERDGSIVLLSNDHMMSVPKSAIASHFTLLGLKANAGQQPIRQTMIVDVTAERLYDRSMVADFIASRIVWIGILATIIGVIMAFWPMIGDGAAIDRIRGNIGEFFGGIAVAFIPTAVSFVFKIVLDFNTRIITTGVRELIDKIAVVSETELLPMLDRGGDMFSSEA